MRKSKHSISGFLKEHDNPEINRYIEKNIAIVEKVRVALADKGWSKEQLVDALGESPLTVARWLCGLHNLSLKEIVKIEHVLGIDLV